MKSLLFASVVILYPAVLATPAPPCIPYHIQDSLWAECITAKYIIASPLLWQDAPSGIQVPEDKPPTLTEIQKLQIQNAAQKLEIAQLRFKAAQEELMGLLSKVSVPGYELDLATLTYRKKEPKK